MYAVKCAEEGIFTVKITVKIDGMVCSMCEAHIADKIRNTFSVKSVTVSRKNGECVIIAGNDITDSKLQSAVSDIGYEASSVLREPYEKKKGLFSRLSGK